MNLRDGKIVVERAGAHVRIALVSIAHGTAISALLLPAEAREIGTDLVYAAMAETIPHPRPTPPVPTFSIPNAFERTPWGAMLSPEAKKLRDRGLDK